MKWFTELKDEIQVAVMFFGCVVVITVCVAAVHIVSAIYGVTP